MEIEYPNKDQLLETLREMPDACLDFILLITGALDTGILSQLKEYLNECIRVLKPGGLLFVQGQPEYLPSLGIALDQFLNFKYWIAIESTTLTQKSGLPSRHAAILLFTKGNNRFNINKVRFPHERCSYCGQPLKDWGGKTHLMHPEGVAVSDVWHSLPQANNYSQLSTLVIDTIIRMVDFDPQRLLSGLIGPSEGVEPQKSFVAEPAANQYCLPGFNPPRINPYTASNTMSPDLVDIIHHGDAVEVLKKYPDNSIDLVFADPPYNLNKAYTVYDDEHRREEYINWCNSWLYEYVRILKPTGSLYLLNLPRWTMYHADFLNRHLHFQNWIVWDALSEPRGKLMPAHYGLLFYTKDPVNFTFNYNQFGNIDARYYCLRSSCIRQRKLRGVDDKEPLTDFWWDIHRIKHRRDRDYHPCQLPEVLMERIIHLSSREGDIVLDALSGTGTTAVVSARLNRHYVAIDIDEKYVQITRDKIEQITQQGYIARHTVRKVKPRYSKKALQLELRDLTIKLGRLPTPEDVQQMSVYSLDAFLQAFPTWGKALKAAKMEVGRD